MKKKEKNQRTRERERKMLSSIVNRSVLFALVAMNEAD